MATIKRVQPSDTLAAHLSAKTFNYVFEATERVLNDGDTGIHNGVYDPTRVWVENTEDDPLGQGTVVGIYDNAIDPSARKIGHTMAIQTFAGRVPVDADFNRFAILSRRAVGGERVPAIIRGAVAVRLHVPEDGDWITRADIDASDQTRMLADPAGSATILWSGQAKDLEFQTDQATSDDSLDASSHGLESGQEVELESTGTLPSGLSPSTPYYVTSPTANSFKVATSRGGTPETFADDGTGTHTVKSQTVDAIVALNGPENVQLIGKTKAEVASGSTTGVVTVWRVATPGAAPVSTNFDIDSVYLDWMHGDDPGTTEDDEGKISAGKEVLIEWFPNEKLWRIIGAECEDPGEPDYGTIYTPAGTDQDLTTTWTAPTGMIEEKKSGGIVTGDPNSTGVTNGIGTTEPGHYRLDLSWTASVRSNNQQAQVRLVNHKGDIATGATMIGRTQGDVIGSSSQMFLEVTEAELIANGGLVYSVIEASSGVGGGINGQITWQTLNLSMQRV